MSKGDALDQIVARLNSEAKWNAGLLKLVLWSEGRHYLRLVNEAPEAKHLPLEARIRVAAKTAVQMATRAFHDEVRADLEGIQDLLVEQLMTMLGAPEQTLKFN